MGELVIILSDEYLGHYGSVSAVGNDSCKVRLSRSPEEVTVFMSDLEVVRYDDLPMWGTLWTFSHAADSDWLATGKGLQVMADCGFRIYTQTDLGYVFGIDGAGYDFYEKHWIQLYRARGLGWHEE